MSSNKKSLNLGWQILIALILGIVVGYYLHQMDSSNNSLQNTIIVNILKPAGDIFISLIKMIVLPIILSTLTLGIASLSGAKHLGKLGLKTIIYFEIITTIAIFLGLFLANTFEPGVGIDISALHQDNEMLDKFTKATNEISNQPHGIVVMILDMIPKNIFNSLSANEVLPVIVFCVFFGLGLTQIADNKRESFNNFLQTVADVMFKVTNSVMKYAPIGVFALMAVTIAKFGVQSLLPLVKLVVLTYAGMILFVIIVLGLVCYFAGFKIFTILKILKEELIIAYSTASSETALPKIMEKMEAYGAPNSIVSFVVPTGYSFNLDGSTLFQSITVIFIAQMLGCDLSLLKQLEIVIVLVIASKGIAGVPGASIIVLTATLQSVSPPEVNLVQGIAYIMAVERILDMARTAVNVVGNAIACLIISRWEGVFDDSKARVYEEKYL